ncbi:MULTISPECIES: hypothetical protein [unclassified Fibrobacter]|uniref:hypothetical protein n=1 Tax=unclassified Fibrobacter TaxID=2634177 RepID=UPI000D6AC1B0|nr:MULTISPECIES: hypothetical protein [unclassified Fibrobacter]PWJ68367.1 hypothetical protein BGX12_10893 [Fibrobacter sp. UWR4]PZW68099.1 hypothetical protein C8E88_10206 [Fibrobacter sp. UWR1]
MNFKVFAAAAALLASQSFAILGVGVHYAPGFGTKMDGMKAPAKVTDDGTILVKHDGFNEMMQGIGFKAWIDLLPIIDVEATVNIQFGSYDASLYVLQDKEALSKILTEGGEVDPSQIDLYKEIPLKVEMGSVPSWAEANPKFFHMNGDLTITYPITFIPIIRPYIGGGVTFNMNSFILNQSFTHGVVNGIYSAVLQSMKDEMSQAAADALANPEQAADIMAQMDPAQMADRLAQRIQDQAVDNIKEAAMEEGLTTSIGGHVMLGLRAKLPIIPIAAYANFKYYFGGDYPAEIDAGNMTAEIGVGFAL